MIFGKPLSDVTFDDVKKLVLETKESESILLDYKSGVDKRDREMNEDIAKDVSSFANHFGGYLIYGVDEQNADPTGFSDLNIDPKILKDKIIKVCASPNMINPPVFLEDPKLVEGEIEGHKVRALIVKVDESPAAPHHFKSGTIFYMRSGDTNQPVEGNPEAYSLILNRREKMEVLRNAALEESKNLSQRWYGRAYHPHNEEVDYESYKVPFFFVCLQPRFYDLTAIKADTVARALRESADRLISKFSLGRHSYENFCESNLQESHSSTIIYRWHERYSSISSTVRPNVTWTAANRAGMLFHFEDMPLKAEGQTPNLAAKKSQYAFASTMFLRRIMGFLFFAKEFYALCNKHFSLDLTVECFNTANMLMMFDERPVDGRHVIENHFRIKRNLTTYDLMDEFIEQLVVNDIVPELLLCINYMPNRSLDTGEVSQIKEPFLKKSTPPAAGIKS